MFGIGFLELVFICVAVLLVVGPKKLPDVMKQAGRFFVQIRRTANDVRSTFDQVVREAEDEIRREEADALRALTSKPTTAKTVTPALEAPGAKPFDPHHQAAHDPIHDAQPPHHGDQQVGDYVDPGHNPDGTLKTTDAEPAKPTNT